MATINYFDEYDLREEFRANDCDYFSIDGYKALLKYLEEHDIDIESDLDVDELCCDFKEESAEQIIFIYDCLEDIADCKDEDGNIHKLLLIDTLNYHTFAVELNNGNIFYKAF